MTRKVRLAHFSVAPILFVVEVEYIVGRCPGCRRTTRQEITFKAEGCMCTRFFRNSILYYCSKGDMTIKAIASLLGVNRNLVKAIDRRRLEEAYGGMESEGVHRYIGIDEFSLHRNHVAMFGKMERPIRPNGVSWPLKTEWLLNNVVRS